MSDPELSVEAKLNFGSRLQKASALIMDMFVPKHATRRMPSCENSQSGVGAEKSPPRVMRTQLSNARRNSLYKPHRLWVFTTAGGVGCQPPWRTTHVLECQLPLTWTSTKANLEESFEFGLAHGVPLRLALLSQ